MRRAAPRAGMRRKTVCPDGDRVQRLLGGSLRQDLGIRCSLQVERAHVDDVVSRGCEVGGQGEPGWTHLDGALGWWGHLGRIGASGSCGVDPHAHTNVGPQP